MNHAHFKSLVVHFKFSTNIWQRLLRVKGWIFLLILLLFWMINLILVIFFQLSLETAGKEGIGTRSLLTRSVRLILLFIKTKQYAGKCQLLILISVRPMLLQRQWSNICISICGLRCCRLWLLRSTKSASLLYFVSLICCRKLLPTKHFRYHHVRPFLVYRGRGRGRGRGRVEVIWERWRRVNFKN